ncbi:hypothetical protein SAMN05444678_106201 [Sphingomonas sp. YR710]|nr:hypothetical protein SAMN05444678_106201 [Sphingomonas sp. YR710]
MIRWSFGKGAAADMIAFRIVIGMIGLVLAPSALEAARHARPPVASETYILIEPVRDGGGHARTMQTPDGRVVPLARRIVGGSLSEAIHAALRIAIGPLLPALDADARARSRYPNHCPDLGAGIFIYLSDEDGGFARKDLYLQEGASAPRLCEDHYIDITADAGSIASGEFEEVLAHEYGHVLLRRLLGPIPATPSRTPHSVLAVTDPVTAFDEGFGISMQPLAARLTATPGFRARIERRDPPSPRDFWFSRHETWLRETAVPNDDFVFEKPEPAAGADPREAWTASLVSAQIDPCRLKNGNRMLASEGVAATFFYRLVNDGPEPPTERLHKLAAALAHIGRWTDAPMIAFIRGWGEAFPPERMPATRLFVQTTYGATASDAAMQAAATLSCKGAGAALDDFVDGLKSVRAGQERLVGDIVGGRLAIDAAIGPGLWIADRAVRIPAQFWSTTPGLPLVLDLNSASAADLRLMLDAGPLADRIVSARAEGRFRSFDDLFDRARLLSMERRRIEGLAAAYQALPRFVRE